MLVNDGEMLVNDDEMLVNDGELSIWSYIHFTIIEKLHRLLGYALHLLYSFISGLLNEDRNPLFFILIKQTYWTNHFNKPVNNFRKNVFWLNTPQTFTLDCTFFYFKRLTFLNGLAVSACACVLSLKNFFFSSMLKKITYLNIRHLGVQFLEDWHNMVFLPWKCWA